MGRKYEVELNTTIGADIEVYISALAIGSYDKGKPYGPIEFSYPPSSELFIDDIKIYTQDKNELIQIGTLNKSDYNRIYAELEDSFWDMYNSKDDRY
jgi:hypothetical protein